MKKKEWERRWNKEDLYALDLGILICLNEGEIFFWFFFVFFLFTLESFDTMKCINLLFWIFFFFDPYIQYITHTLSLSHIRSCQSFHCLVFSLLKLLFFWNKLKQCKIHYINMPAKHSFLKINNNNKPINL